MPIACPSCGRADCATVRGGDLTRRQVLKGIGVLGLGVAAAPLLAACQGSAGHAGNTSSSGPVKTGGTATMAIFGSFGPVLLPNFTNNGNARAVTQCFNGSLFIYDQKLNFVPSLAASYKLASDNVTYTFKLRPNVKWSDGKPLTAGDFVAAVLAMAHPATVTNWISYVQEIDGVLDRKAGKRQDVPGVKVVDDLTLQVKLAAPAADFLDLFGTQFQPLPKHVIDPIPTDQLLKKSFAQVPTVSLGPFRMTSRSGDNSVTLERNPHFWGSAAKLDKIIIQNLTTTQAVPAMLSGALDVIPGEVVAELDPTDAASLKKNANVTVVTYENSATTTLYLNEKTLFGDVRVRQAVLWALDRAAMVKSVLDGYGVVADSAYPPFSPYYDANSLVKYTQNTDKAKQLLAEVNWDSSKSVDFVVPTGDSTVQQLAVFVQQELAAIGINAKIDQVDNNTGVTRLIHTHTFDMAIFSNVGENNLDLSRRFATASYATGVNAGGFSDPKLDTLMAQALRTPRLQDQLPLTRQIQKIISEQVPTGMIYYRNSIAAVNTSKIGGVVPQRGGAWLAINDWYLK